MCLGQGLSAAQQTASLQDLAGQLAGRPGATTIFVAREFLTMDAKKPRAQAVAVRDGRFIAVGTRAEVEAAAGKGAKIDTTFADKVVIAGFVEQHVHPVLAALTMNTKVISIEDWDAIDGFSSAVRDEKTYQERLKKALAAHTDKKKPFVSWGYHHYFHGEMSRDLLNTLAPDFPVIVWHRSCHEFFLNDAALKAAGIDKAFVDSLPKSAQEQLSLEKGHFFEQGAMPILPKIAPFLATPELFKKGLEFTETYYHRNGITLACEPGGFPSRPIQDLINSVYSDDATPFNHCFMADGKTLAASNPKDPKAMLAAGEQVLDWGKGRTWYLPKQVKLLTDGAIYSQLMMMKDGYTDGHHGAWIMDPPVFDYAFQAYWDAGYQIHVHNNGDAGMDVLLGELEKAMARNPRKDHRTVLVHFGFAQPRADCALDRARRHRQLESLLRDGARRPLREARRRAGALGQHGAARRRARGPAGRCRSIPTCRWRRPSRCSSCGRPSPADGGGRRGRAAAQGPARRGPPAITIDAAYSIQQEKKVGSIEVGKHANLTVLDKSPYEVAPTAIRDIAIWGTMLEGRVQKAPAAPKATASSADGLQLPAAPAANERGANDRTAHGSAGDGCDVARILASAVERQLTGGAQ